MLMTGTAFHEWPQRIVSEATLSSAQTGIFVERLTFLILQSFLGTVVQEESAVRGRVESALKLQRFSRNIPGRTRIRWEFLVKR